MYKYFKLEEFACKCGCGRNEIDPVFVDRLDALREAYGKPMYVNSGYRCPAHNSAVSRTGTGGPHTGGKAADIRADRGDAYRLVQLAMAYGFNGVGVQQKGNGRYIHLDMRDNPTIWSY